MSNIIPLRRLKRMLPERERIFPISDLMPGQTDARTHHDDRQSRDSRIPIFPALYRRWDSPRDHNEQPDERHISEAIRTSLAAGLDDAADRAKHHDIP